MIKNGFFYVCFGVVHNKKDQLMKEKTVVRRYADSKIHIEEDDLDIIAKLDTKNERDSY